MAKDLIIVESPNKADKIRRMFNKKYIVIATGGHIEDLDETSFGITRDLQPVYKLHEGKDRIIENVIYWGNYAKNIYLATDPDREGEFIAFSVYRHLPDDIRNKCKRIRFYAVTKKEIENAITRVSFPVDINLVKAQQARRILDRLIGYVLSAIASYQLGGSYSVGRVQSPVLRMIVDRAISREVFIPGVYYEANLIYDLFGSVGARSIYLNVRKGFKSHSDAERFVTSAKNSRVSRITTRRISIPPKSPLTTSLLQQSAHTRYGIPSDRIMRLAQQLFEEGCITYPRTDSTYISDEGMALIKTYIEKVAGEEYYLARQYETYNQYFQEAHEAIRPTGNGLSSNDKMAVKLYKLINKRAFASQMKDAEVEVYNIEVELSDGQRVTTKAHEVKFPGWYKVMPEEMNRFMPPPYGIREGMELKPPMGGVTAKETKPAPLLNNCDVVSKMEKYSIGRPSTYATVVNTVSSERKGFVEMEELTQRFVPTLKAKQLIEYLRQKYPSIIDYEFTARMEKRLDLVARGAISSKQAIEETLHEFKERDKIDLIECIEHMQFQRHSI